MALTYDPEVYEVRSEDAARKLILPPTDKLTTDERWEKETAPVFEEMVRELRLQKNQLLLDYGCGIGRLAKEVCARECNVIGVDISKSMRNIAREYVNSDRFIALSPQEFDLLVGKGLRVDAACAVWVLQHCFNPSDDLTRIFNALKLQGGLYVVNNRIERQVPVKEEGKWIGDQKDVWKLTLDLFSLTNTRPLPAAAGIPSEKAFSRTYMKTRDHL